MKDIGQASVDYSPTGNETLDGDGKQIEFDLDNVDYFEGEFPEECSYQGGFE